MEREDEDEPIHPVDPTAPAVTNAQRLYAECRSTPMHLRERYWRIVMIDNLQRHWDDGLQLRKALDHTWDYDV